MKCLSLARIALISCFIAQLPAGGGGRGLGGGEGALPIMAYMGRLRQKGVLFSRFEYVKG